MNKLFNTIPGDRSDTSYVKLFSQKLLEKTGGSDKMKLIMQNAVNNYNYDNNIFDAEDRTYMEKYSAV